MPAARHVGEMRMKNSGVIAVAREFNFKRFFYPNGIFIWEIIRKGIFNFAYSTGGKFIKVKKLLSTLRNLIINLIIIL